MKKRISAFFYRLTAFTVRSILEIVWNYKVEGRENIPPPPFSLVANHTSMLDPFVIGAIFNHRLYYLAKKELFKIPLFNPLLRWLGAIDVDRKDFKFKTWRKIQSLVKNKEIMVIFPEGTRNENPEKGLLDFKDGAATLAFMYGLTILPVGIKGTEKIWQRKQILPNIKGNIIVRIGKPIKVLKVLKPTKEQIKKLNEEIRTAILELLV
ncbi:MAG TPA: lysophospholipid acyltransferase family protein [Dictyoglomaceae bacterium]|nr:lysophospholipid acyltransferase family protein [Dictyoglomaceae bacterium]HOL40008.1 lysophospholipid acyltransferase family protein [Dictyoglomaceae bacterium]HOP95431.1 lysophospholipid acyltransferase family protein [Dictyoglomaceae bacterium]HPP15587.1 lysophospholipid acyltransferase family protein [Dictyoglomaceae bacterium]HPU42902.1 lysophospholipid acyltransferase family protein [Dictyoglomaceae bacterium]